MPGIVHEADDRESGWSGPKADWPQAGNGMAECRGLERRLREIAAEFFRSKLTIQPQAVRVSARKDRIRIRVRGVLPSTEEASAGHPTDRETRRAYYERMLEKLWPMLDAVVEEASGQVLGERRLALDLGRSTCVYYLRLRSDVRRGQADAAAAAQSGEKVP